MRHLVVGASAGVGRALAASLASRGDDLLLVAGDERDLAAVAAHTALVHRVDAHTLAVDLGAPGAPAEVLAAIDETGGVDTAFFPVGASRDDDDGLLRGDDVSRLLRVNLEVVADVTAALLPGFVARGRGSIVGFGSVAAASGRGRNVVYAAAKRGLRSLFESLAFVTHGTGVEAQLWELGYVDTSQSFGKRLFPPPVAPEAVAKRAVAGLGTGSRIDYFPAYWRLIAGGVRVAPAELVRRLGV